MPEQRQPSEEEIKAFQDKGRQSFPDEVLLGQGLIKVFNTPKPQPKNIELPKVDTQSIRRVIENNENGYLSPVSVQNLLDAAGINRAGEAVATTKQEAIDAAKKLGMPVVMKVIGPVHKSDVGGVVLNVKNTEAVATEFERMIKIKDTTSILLQPMLSGTEIFAGVKKEDKFGHLIMCGLGGIFIEVLKDVNVGLSPLSKNEASEMIKNLKSYKIIQGVRGQEGINEDMFADIVVKLSALVEAAPEIIEMDINPLLGKADDVVAVDARIRIKK